MSKKIIGLLTAMTMGLTGIGAFPSGTFGGFDIKADADIISGGPCGDNVIWEFDSDGTLKFSGKGEMAYTNTLSQYSSEWEGFRNVGEIKKVVIEEGITNIVSAAFNYCQSLESVIIPSSVTDIGTYAFFKCPNLKSVTIPDSVTYIGMYAFSGCSSLENISIPSSLETLGHDAFEGTPFLEAKRAESPIYVIGDHLIDGRSAKGNAVIPDGVAVINDFSFYNNTDLTGVTIPSSVKFIDFEAFYGCTSMKSITIPETTKLYMSSLGYYDKVEDNHHETCKTDDFTIIGYNGTSAEKYAVSNGFDFVSLGNAPGDFDGSGAADVDDLVLMQKITAGWKVDVKYTSAADLNGDKDVDVDDLVLMQKKVAGWKV
ncbi:MAG: leucine-rich repeat protein [Ruminococcus sp.]|nr:leucine-rich repeat protein [Ruminococcus sp.]